MAESSEPPTDVPEAAAVTAPAAVRPIDSTGRHATLVAAGILLSRLAGLLRNSVLGSYFSTSLQADAFAAAVRIPNFLQNLFGEGVLSASFIPVYASLIARGEREEARRVAGAVLALLSLAVAVLVLLSVFATPILVDVIVPGFEGAKRELTIGLVRILFPGAGLLALSAWCLGILNSHRRFLLSYSAPVIWSLSMAAAALVMGSRVGLSSLAVIVAWASVAGSLLQLLVQLPAVLSLLGRLRPSLDITGPVREVVRNFAPVFVGRGVVQISGYVDSFLASLLVTGSVAAIGWAQVLYTLPVSLFGMSVSAAELPAMSSTQGDERQVAEQLRARLLGGMRRIAFWIVPSAVAFLALGDVIAAAVYQRGRFGPEQSLWVWGILAGSAVGLLASTLGRLYASALYALRDTRSPLRFALARVACNIVLGYTLSTYLPRILNVDARWGAAGLTIASGIAGWMEFALLRRAVGRRVGPAGVETALLARLWVGALLGAAAGWGARLVVDGWAPVAAALVVLGAYGATYFAVTGALGVAEARSTVRAVAGRLRSRR